jgi:hypothetical protein
MFLILKHTHYKVWGEFSTEGNSSSASGNSALYLFQSFDGMHFVMNYTLVA